MSWWDKLFNRDSTVETRLEVGDASLLRKENKQAALDVFEVQQVTGKAMTLNDLYARPWRYAVTRPEKIKVSDLGIDATKITPEVKRKLEDAGIFDFG